MDASHLPVRGPDTWTDIQGLSGLARAARDDGKAALPAVARQFEAVFAQMLIKSMRQASFGGGILDSPQSNQWRGMFDNQIALSLANDGKGLGIAAMLVRQLGGNPQGSNATATDPTALSSQLRAARTLPAASAAAPAATFTTDGTAANSSGTTEGVFDRAIDFVKTAGRNALHTAQQWVFSGPDDFVQKLAPYAQAVANKLGVSMRAVLAQAALETGWGQHMPQQADGSSSNNLFGMKAGDGWQGKRVSEPTLEFKDGVAVRTNAAFRAYAGPARSFADYARLLTENPRYAGALGHGEDIAGFARALHSAGYATDPDYAAKLTTIANSDTMRDALTSLKDSTSTPTTEL
ncbi:MAG TPA: flagellar assembly peptidoglycan hydrolase FlgJ [Rhodanobacteraceae bacterium]|nr:flagellar assembly peptidoglycan hydrolase FlgJ [Rhodanobacteraceae bacterium]